MKDSAMENVNGNGAAVHGSAGHGPWFAMCGSATAMLPASRVIEMLEANIQAQAGQNLALSALFRRVADAFREWSRASEPGWVFSAPEVTLHIIRLASGAQQAVVVSEAMEKAAKARAAIADERMEVAGREYIGPPVEEPPTGPTIIS